MKNKLRQTLASMNVRQNREEAETKALDILRSGEGTFNLLVDLGWESLKGNLQENRELLRSVSFTLALFMTREKPAEENDASAVDLLIKLASLGFNSAKNCLNHLGFTPKEIRQHHLLSLPLSERRTNDREISLGEALAEIELSRSLEGNKGVSGHRYSLGKDAKHRYDMYRVDRKRFVLRTVKNR